ncbi:MAG: hypothetical protein RLZZ450_853 [Pseudomonadota bacterium]|jgi:hypothetical protein
MRLEADLNFIIVSAGLVVGLPLLWHFQPARTSEIHTSTPALCAALETQSSSANAPALREREQCRAICAGPGFTFQSRWYGDSCACSHDAAGVPTDPHCH